MIKPLTKSLTLCLLAIASLTACKKDKNEQVAPTKESLAGTYTLSSMKASATGFEDVDLMADYEACKKDDEYILNANLTYQYKDAGTVCDDDESYTSSWQLNDKTIITPEMEGTIESFNGKTLVIVETYSDNGMTFKVKATLQKK